MTSKKYSYDNIVLSTADGKWYADYVDSDKSFLLTHKDCDTKKQAYELAKAEIDKLNSGEVKESIVKELDGSRSVLVSFHNERCHAKIVDKIPDEGEWFHTGYSSMGYDIYQKRSYKFDPWDNYIAIKENEIMENKVKQVVSRLLEGKSLNDAIMLKESIDNNKIQALIQFLDLDLDDEDNWNNVFVSTYDDNVYYYKNDNNDFRVCTDDEANDEFHNSFMNLVDDLGLDSFSPHAKDYILNNFCDDDVIDDYYQDDVRSYAEDIQNEDNKPETYTVKDENGDDVEVEVTNRLFQECMENDVLDLDDFTVSDFEDGDYIGDTDLVDLYCEKYQTPEDQGYDNGYDWLKFSFGADYANKFISDHNAIDWDKVAEYVKDEDGRGNELNSWDGKEYEEEVNGTTYYIYPNCDFEELKGESND